MIDDDLKEILSSKDVDVSVETGSAILEAGSVPLIQMLTRLVTNGYQALPGGGSLRLSASQSGGSVQMIVEDSEQGIDPKTAGQLFDRFLCSKAVVGIGLGLAMVQPLSEVHGGSVSLGPGTRR